MSLSALYMIGQDGTLPFPPSGHGRNHDIPFGGCRRTQGSSRSLTSAVKWSVVSRISQMQAWAIPAVRKSTDPHCGPLICCLAARALCQPVSGSAWCLRGLVVAVLRRGLWEVH